MTKKTVFDFNSYKAYLKAFFEQPGNPVGIRSRFAQAIESQSSFISQVLTGKAELSLDQAYRASQFLEHTTDEADYFLILVQLHRSTGANYKKFLEDKIQKMRQERVRLKNRVNTNREISTEARAQYYSSWIYTAIHIAASLKDMNSARDIADYLGLKLEVVHEALHFLESEGLVHVEAGTVKMGQTHIHLPSDSVLVRTHHANWRARAIQSLEKSLQKDLHYSVVYSLSRKDAEIIKRKIADLIQENLKVVAPSEEEVLFANVIDFFEVSKD
ncbi:hypothetical protein AZI86_04340 [Bdellovibrio bacteriovorus]|uniref:DUF4423 domain-containing protein n=1 Tax=Bdellovibrio bacteriovorus TaxID=959 RepID=A0A150WP64_BDEBC|nr:TIGR02147 family protein [Bdellovibrio bacteriovorus]KYG66291.1 hypothetical protein AZI86_04340 [Bdellovibrio bacteriovorus]